MRRHAHVIGRFGLFVSLTTMAAFAVRCSSFGSDEPTADASTVDGAPSPALDGSASVPDGGGGVEPGGPIDAEAGSLGTLGASCSPADPCSSELVCCMAIDGGSSCRSPVDCPSDHASTRCRRTTECPGESSCCFDTSPAPAGSGLSYLIRTSCRDAPCASLGLSTACVDTSDCDTNSCALPQYAYPPTGVGHCQ